MMLHFRLVVRHELHGRNEKFVGAPGLGPRLHVQPGGHAEIYLLARGSAKWVNLTRSEASENRPRWSPDGNRIAFQSNLNGNLDIWVMDADGSKRLQLTHDPRPITYRRGRRMAPG